ncbi:hypothetical protein BC629DRAFT_1598313 [Irpex lacteus]|nr:hypothetical protein BC629DRAFT_1598313 [Irpex lacteus]
MEADPNPTNSTETDEVEFLGREIEYLGRSKRTNKQNDEDDEIEYMGYSIPALMPAGEYWVKAKYGGWERWDMPEKSVPTRPDYASGRAWCQRRPSNAKRERRGKTGGAGANEMKKTYQAHRQGLYFIFRTPMKRERLATAAIEDRLNQKNPHGFHQVQRQDHPVMYIAQARHQRPQAQLRACSPARTAVRTTGASNDRRLSDAEILARLPPGSKLGPPRGARRANNASMLAKAAMDPDHNITPHSKSPLSNAYGEGQLTDVSAKSRRDARHANMSIASSTSFSPGENIGLQRGSHRVHEHSLPEPCHDHGEMNTESADSGAKTSHHKARRSTKPYDRATRSRGYSAS